MTLAGMIMSIVNGSFKKISSENVAITVVIFFAALGLLVISLITFLVQKRFPAAIDWLTPIYGFYLFLCLLPVTIEDPRKPKFLQGQSLIIASILDILACFVLAAFGTSRYSIASAGRVIFYLNGLNLFLRLGLTPQFPLGMMLLQLGSL